MNYMMSSLDSLSRTTESFQRLENFPSYTSCIKSFRKPIIPPLLTIEQREEISRIRNAASKIETLIVNKKKKLSSLSNNEKEINRRDEENLAANYDDDFYSYCDTPEHESSALHVSKGTAFYTCPMTDSTLISNELHMSTSKIPSDNICSTVHKDVIVFPNVINTSSNENYPTSNTDPNNVLHPEYYQYQMEDHTESLASTEMPGEVTRTVQMHSVSEDEHDSITESTEFESLPTVISARKAISQDTDNESNATCLSQSTDLEKYMDSSIEYSSPDDVTTLAQSQMSSQLNMSTRSDDASSETLVNTESELTPCASAMAMLNCAGDAQQGDDKSPSMITPYVPQRSYSVDSYAKMLKVCAKKSPIRKTQSEPSNSDSKSHSIDNTSTQGQNLPNSVMVDQELKAKDSQNESAPVSDSEICITFESKAELKKSLKRKHVRSNSYTLDHPSPALIMAHADCNCSTDSPDFSPHSCSLDKKSVSPQNPAFKKEKVNIVLPPTTERDKFFPFLSAMSPSTNKPDNDEIEESKTSTSDILAETDILAPEAALSINKEKVVADSGESLPASNGVKQIQNSEENSNTESFEDNSEAVSVLDTKSQEVILDTGPKTVSSGEPCELKSNDFKELLEGVIRDVKEIQKNKVNQFLEEQNKLWFKMQEEFKEQEKLLCEKLNIVNIASFSDGSHPMSYQFSDVDVKNCSVIENNLQNLNSNGISFSNSYPDAREDCFIPQTSNIEISSVDTGSVASEQLSNQTSAHSQSSKSVSDIASSNFKSFHNSIDNSQSATSFQSSASTREESGSSSRQLGQTSSLSITTHNSLPSNSADDQVRSSSSQSNLYSEPISNARRQFKNLKLEGLSDRSDSFSIMSETSVDGPFKDPEMPMDNSEDSSRSGIISQSIYRSALSAANDLETNFSSTSFRTSSDLSQYSDMTKLYRDSQFLNANNCPDCILSPISISDNSSDQDHKGSRSVCPDCQSCLRYCSKHIFPENLTSDDDSHFANAIDPVKFPTFPSFAQGKKATSMSTDQLLSLKTGLVATKKSFKNVNKDTLDCKVSEANSATEQYSLLTNNLRSNMHSCQNTLVMNTKNNLAEVNGIEDESYGESEIRAINDLVQSSYTRSYSCQLNEDYCGAVAINNLPKNQSHLRNSQSLYQIPSNSLSNDENGTSKKISTTSLTNLKRRQSRDIIKDPILLKRFERLPALVKGYLTRRLFKTERVQDLIKTLQDTAVLLGNLSQELNLKGNSVSENDVDLHRKLIVQLMTSFESFYDIFCTLSIKEQMEIISESRNFRMKKKAMEKSDSTVPRVAEKCSSSPNKRPKLSAATLKALERKRSSLNSRTYTIEDFKGCKQRIQSIASSSKSHSISPTRIYKSTAGTSMKRKTTSVRKANPWK